ncbi:transposase family protein [Adhaeretor mobilis]|uniref:transposase family protein n=1 Tax=Adhaeretor mobilis TaxID=1930276 RepID=UPI001C54D385|nr:transposase family protein [Adhaeretor mobilis]
MNTAHTGSLPDQLQQFPDPHGANRRRHSLEAVLATVVCAVLCGTRGYKDISGWIHVQVREVWYLLGYHRTPATCGAFRDLMIKINPELLEEILRGWVTQHTPMEANEIAPLAIDGKTLCSTLDEHGRSLQPLSLFDQSSGYVLSQMAVPANTKKYAYRVDLLLRDVGILNN